MHGVSKTFYGEFHVKIDFHSMTIEKINSENKNR